MLKRGAENNKEAEARLLLKGRRLVKHRRDNEAALEMNPNKTR